MAMSENLDSARVVYTLGLWAPERLESGSSDSGRLDPENWNWILPSKVQWLIMISLIADFSSSKNESILARIG